MPFGASLDRTERTFSAREPVTRSKERSTGFHLALR